MSHSESRVLDTAAGPDTLGDIEAALERTWSAHPHVPEPVRMHMGIAAGEIGANILEHAAGGRIIHVGMDVWVHPDQVHVEFTDDGAPFEADLDAVTMPDDMAERGRGLALARAVLEQLIYRRSDVNHWTLVSKRFS